MKVSTAFPSTYLKAADLQGKQVRVVIDRVGLEEVGDGHKPVIYFKDKDKGLVLNKTNANNISLVYGDEMDDWIGEQIELFESMVDFQGRTVPAIRVRVPRQSKTLPSGAVPTKSKTVQAYDETNPPPIGDVPF